MAATGSFCSTEDERKPPLALSLKQLHPLRTIRTEARRINFNRRLSARLTCCLAELDDRRITAAHTTTTINNYIIIINMMIIMIMY